MDLFIQWPPGDLVRGRYPNIHVANDDSAKGSHENETWLGVLSSTELTELLSLAELNEPTKLLSQTELTELTGGTELTELQPDILVDAIQNTVVQ